MANHSEFGLALVGVNHKTASLGIRNKLALTVEQVTENLRMLRQKHELAGIAILSTCNRTEWHCHASGDRFYAFLRGLKEEHLPRTREADNPFYIYQEADAVRHLVRVASGLDSMILGEAQILGQVKLAYNLAKDLGTLSPTLERLFQLAFGTAKKVRTETELGTSAVSVAYAAVALAKQIFENIQNTRVLLIGAGDTIERVAFHLKEQGVSEIVVANRNLDRARTLTEKVGGKAVYLADIPQHLALADLVFSATASSLPILGKGLVERVLKKSKHRPLFMVDLAVPRDIEPEVAEIPDVYLYTIDHLEQLIGKNKEARLRAATKAESMIEEELTSILNALRMLNVSHVVKRYRDQMESIRDQAVQNAIFFLTQGVPADEVVTELGRKLTNKLIHKPCTLLRQAGSKSEETLLMAAQKLLETS